MPTRTTNKRRAATPRAEWLGKLPANVSKVILGKLSESDLNDGATELRSAIDGEQQAWLKTAHLLAAWRERFLVADLSISDHYEPWAEAATGKGVGSIRTYLAGRRMALELGISTMSKEVLQAVSMYDTETARAILEESGGDIAKTREVKARLAAEKAAQDPEAAAKEAVNRANRIKRFAKTFRDDIVSAVGDAIREGLPVDAATFAAGYVQGFRDGTMRMAPKTGLVRAEEMTAGVELVISELQSEAAQAAEAAVGPGELPVQ